MIVELVLDMEKNLNEIVKIKKDFLIILHKKTVL